MVRKILIWLYANLSSSQVKLLGRAWWLKPFRNWILRGKGKHGMLEVEVHWSGLTFYYHGDIKSALKAKRKGIEGSLLRLSAKLLREEKAKVDDATVLDVGASYGFLSTVWAMSSCRRGQVYGFEASPSFFTVGRKMAEKNGLANLTYVNQAVYNFDGLIQIQPFDGTHAMVSKDSNGVLVSCITIDSFCERNQVKGVDLIKIDVDGPEFEVLEGAKNVMANESPIVILESNGDSRLLSFFDPARYSLFDLALNPLIDSSVPPTIVAIPKRSF